MVMNHRPHCQVLMDEEGFGDGSLNNGTGRANEKRPMGTHGDVRRPQDGGSSGGSNPGGGGGGYNPPRNLFEEVLQLHPSKHMGMQLVSTQ